MRILLIVVSLLLSFAMANGRKPCDRGAGGVSHCSGGRFVCENGTISKSHLRCASDEAADENRSSKKSKKKTKK